MIWSNTTFRLHDSTLSKDDLEAVTSESYQNQPISFSPSFPIPGVGFRGSRDSANVLFLGLRPGAKEQTFEVLSRSHIPFEIPGAFCQEGCPSRENG